MEYGINIDFVARRIGMKKAAEMVSKAGFTMLDYTPPLVDDNWETIMKEHSKIFEANGLSVNQTHAPMNRYGQYGDKFEIALARCADATEFLGAKYEAAHGDEFDFDNMEFSPEAAFEYNHKLFLPYVERAEKNGYKIAFETVFEESRWGNPYRRYTSDIDELKGLILSFNSPCAVCCWDFGHANVSFGDDAAKNIRYMGSLIQCTHLHDNTGDDAHQLPMTGKIDWNETMRAFHDIGYSGVLNVEYAYGSMPEDLLEDFVKLSFKTAKHLWSM